MTDRNPKLAQQDDILAAEYALGVLHGKARADFAQRLDGDLVLANAVRRWDEHYAHFAEEIAPVTPPSAVEAALEKRLFGDLTAAKPSLWSSLTLWRGLAFASLLGFVAIGTWALQQEAPLPLEHALVAQVAAEQGPFKMVAYYEEATGQLRVNRLDGAANSGRSLELWLIAGKDAPVSLGVLPGSATARMTMPKELRPKFKNGVLAVSDEPAGGSPTGAPTGAVLATGVLTEI